MLCFLSAPCQIVCFRFVFVFAALFCSQMFLRKSKHAFVILYVEVEGHGSKWRRSVHPASTAPNRLAHVGRLPTDSHKPCKQSQETQKNTKGTRRTLGGNLCLPVAFASPLLLPHSQATTLTQSSSSLRATSHTHPSFSIFLFAEESFNPPAAVKETNGAA